MKQFAFAEHGIRQVEARELVLPWMEHAEGVEAPVVERAVVLELERADGVGDPLDRVREAVREVVHGVNAPLVPGPVMRRFHNAIHDRIAHIQIGRSHIDFGS